MYQQITARISGARAVSSFFMAVCAVGSLLAICTTAAGQIIAPDDSVIRRIESPNEKLELTVSTSRILTLEKRIPRVQVNNPELLSVTPLSATQVQVSAKKAGVTAINLWDEDGQIHAVDVFVYGDVRELEHALETQFPNSSIKVYRYSQALVLTGFIDRPDYVTPIVELAQDYSPKVINNISVGGVQQVLLKVKIFEVSRTKLRRMGSDLSLLNSSGGFLSTGVSGLIANTTNAAPGAIQSIVDTGGQTVEFGIVNGGQQFFGVLDLLQQHSIAKILAEPNIVAVSGRPALFNEGGEIPIVVPQSLGTASIEFKKFGTQVDFLPIVLGNGNIRLEVRPRISELDASNSITLQNVQIPALTVREVDTAVEMKAGQTFALAGLIQRRTEGLNRGIPYLSNMPIIGAPFRRTEERVNEIELLITVTPEFVDAIDPCEVPRCYPGAGTMSPNDKELYWDGRIEVPNRCNGCAECGCIPTHGHEPCCPTNELGFDRPPVGAPGSAFDAGGYGGQFAGQLPPGAIEITPGDGPIEGPQMATPVYPQGEPAMNGPQHGELVMPPNPDGVIIPQSGSSAANGTDDGGRFATPRQSTYQRHASRPYNPNAPTASTPSVDENTGLIGPVGYDSE